MLTAIAAYRFFNLTTYLWPIKFNRFLSNKFSTIKNYIKFIITTLEPSEMLLHADVSTTTWTFCANRNTKMLLPFCSAITCLINKIIKILCRKTFHFSTPSVPPTSFSGNVVCFCFMSCVCCYSFYSLFLFPIICHWNNFNILKQIRLYHRKELNILHAVNRIPTKS